MKIIFTDLDGCLLDTDTYSFKEATEGLRLIKKKKIPLIFCSSKTRSEIEYWRRKIKNKDPFISEDGGGIFIPKKYFKFKFDYTREDKKYYIIQLGTNYKRLVKVINKIKKKFKIKNFYEMTVREISKEAGLDLYQARLSKQREFDEVFKILDIKQKNNILKEIKKNKLNYTRGGRFYHIMRRNDKGKAVEILSNLFKKMYKKITTIGIGDSYNDFEMLERVDIPYLVMDKYGNYSSDKYKKANGIGPVGWNMVVKKEVVE